MTFQYCFHCLQQSIIATGNPATDDGGPANAMQAIGEDHSSDSDVANEDEVQIYPQTATVLTMPPSDEGGQEEKPGQVITLFSS